MKRYQVQKRIAYVLIAKRVENNDGNLFVFYHIVRICQLLEIKFLYCLRYLSNPQA